MRYMPGINNLPIGTQSFEILRSEGSAYVDKTHHIYNLVTSGRVYFLSRPRRFGKSLLISTLEALFKGKRVLFKNTWIDSSDFDWSEYPIIRLDMVDINNHDDAEAFTAALKRRLVEIADEYNVDKLPIELDETSCFSHLIKALAKINKVVVLVDEYDKPILENILDDTKAQAMRNVLRKLYGILKAQDENLKFVMLTGITKFSKVSVFSGLNNLRDLSQSEKYTSLCGYTQSELEQVFMPWVERLAAKQSTSVAEQLAKIKSWYNGYQFSHVEEKVYNPFSTLLLFEEMNYRPYWYESGIPTFLIDLIKAQELPVHSLEEIVVGGMDLQIHDVHQLGLVPLLYQTGYLTIKDYNSDSQNFTLGYPNREVSESFIQAILMHFTQAAPQARTALIDGIVEAVKTCEYALLFSSIQTFFASVPYHLHDASEKHYHNVFYLMLRLAGLKVNAEVLTNIGRIDTIIELDDQVLIFEFKLDKSASEALQQIHDKQYYQAYQQLGKAVILFGVNFSTQTRNIDDRQCEQLAN